MNFLIKLKESLLFWFENNKKVLIKILLAMVIVLISAILFIFLKSNNTISEDVITEQNILFADKTLDNWLSYFTVLGLLVGGVWALYQFEKGKEMRQQEKAAEIAKLFSDSLLSKCELVNRVFKYSKLQELLNTEKYYDSFKVFNTTELRQVYGRDDIVQIYSDLMLSTDFDTIYFSILEQRISIYDNYEEESPKKESNSKNKSSQNNNTKNVQHKYTTEHIRELFILCNSDLPFHFDSLMNDVLNELEQICMNISSQAAGSRYIYQSLHQIFLRTIKTLSLEICTRNHGDYCDKYYTNIIHVYNEWTRIYRKNYKKEKKRKEKVERILNPKIKTV